jgi:hypothetical protein
LGLQTGLDEPGYMVGSACKQAAYEEVDGGGARPPVGPTVALKVEGGGERRPYTV